MPESRRGLFVTLSNLGDALMTTPALELLHAALPDAVIDIVAHPRSGAVFDKCPYLGTLIVREGRGLGARCRTLARLRAHRYDIALDLRSDFGTWLLRARRRIRKSAPDSADRHAVVRHALPLLREGDAIPATRLWVDAQDRAAALSALRGLPGRRWLALGPGCRVPIKLWPPAHYVQLGRLCRDAWDAIVLVGAAEDAATNAEVADGLGLPVRDLTGGLPLHVTAAVLEQCGAFVGSDSGLGHVAAAMGTPTLTLFGIGQPHRYRPWGAKAEWIVAPGHDLRRLIPGVVAERLLAHGSVART